MKRTKLFAVILYFMTITLYSQDQFLYPMGISEGKDEAAAAMPRKTSLNRNFYTSVANSASLEKYAPKPKRQKFGTCTAWAVAYSARTIIEAKRNEWTDTKTITENAFTPAFTYRMVEPTKSDCWGAYTGNAIESLKDIGALPMKFWKRAGDEALCPQQGISDELKQVAGDYKINEFTRLFYSEDYDKSKTDRVKLSIANGNPVVISMICPTSFHRVESGLWEPEENPKIGEHGYHAMSAIGYDDDKHGGAFRIQNSWGERYGDGGFVWVKYKDFNNFVYQGIELVALPKLEPDEPIFQGGLTILNATSGEELDFSVAQKFRNWNVDLGGGSIGEYTYKANEPLSSGSRIRIMINNDQPAFVYVLGTGSVDTSVSTLFPFEDTSAALNYAENEVTLPNEQGSFVMDDTVGEDYMIMMFSREALDIKKIKSQLDNMNGKFSDNLKTVLGDKLVPYDKIDFESNEIQFVAKNTDDEGSVMAMIIAYDHVK